MIQNRAAVFPLGRVCVIGLGLVLAAGVADAQTLHPPRNVSNKQASPRKQPREVPLPSVHIRVDAFGYRLDDTKIVVLRRPVTGHDAPSAYTPGATIELHRGGTNNMVFSGPPVAWGGGAEHVQSGDLVWWFDFSTVQQPGTYRVHDPANGLWSESFRIAADPYSHVRTHAMRMFYYQRCGVPKLVEHVPNQWTDTACHIGPGQDLDCRLVTDQTPATSRDLSGGWHDAGDNNKYVNYTDDAVHDLLDAYMHNPAIWGDDHDIPESGNGVPDILDEARVEFEWLLRMQHADGSVIHKQAVLGHSDPHRPSLDDEPRYYASSTASATISACGAFAHAAVVYADQPDAGSQALAVSLEGAAVMAWDWLDANASAIPSTYDNDGGLFASADAEDDPYTQQMNLLRSAVWLYRLTGNTTYRDYVDANHQSARMFLWSWVSPWERTSQDALAVYSQTPGATPASVSAFLTTFATAVVEDTIIHYTGATDAYGAHMGDGDYTWGSSRTKSYHGHLYMHMIRLGLDPVNASIYRDAATGYAHYMHAVNPNALTYLSNMGRHGAATSLTEMYHGWFSNGSVWDSTVDSLYGPPPGYVPGGANPHFTPDASYTGPPLVPPMGQPIQKSYRDWNTDWPENSWEVTECHIPYQAAYVRLLAELAP